jgi:hypothetical protein
MEEEKSKTYNVVKDCKVENHGGISATVKLLFLISLQITFQSKKKIARLLTIATIEIGL